MKFIVVLLTFITLTIATEYEVEYSISSQYPTEWKKRGTIKCDKKKCVMENEKNLEFRSGKEDTYYIKIGEVYTSILSTILLVI